MMQENQETQSHKTHSVHWLHDPTNPERILVFVYSIVLQRIVYSENTKSKNRRKSFQYIKNYYGVDRLIAPNLDEPADLRKYL